MPDPPECLACGTCCFSDLPEYVRVWGVDHDRLGDLAAAYTHFIGNKCYMRLTDGHCAALELDPAAGRFVCAVYQARPDACRALGRGSSACAAEIHEKGDRPHVALAALRARGAPRA